MLKKNFIIIEFKVMVYWSTIPKKKRGRRPKKKKKNQLHNIKN